jgi:hypothetical protein
LGNTLTRTKINTRLVNDNWDELLRVAASLLTGAVKVSELLRYLAGGGTPTPIGRALMELGRLNRSAYLASYFDDELLRRRVNTQLNRQESRHQLARKIFHGQKGELRQRYKEGQEDQLGALGQVVACAVMLTLTGDSPVWMLILVALIFGVPQGLNSLGLQNSVYFQADPERIASSAGSVMTRAVADRSARTPFLRWKVKAGWVRRFAYQLRSPGRPLR